jgi:hypothetical protein
MPLARLTARKVESYMPLEELRKRARLPSVEEQLRVELEEWKRKSLFYNALHDFLERTRG